MGNFLNLIETPALIILSLVVVFVFFYLRKDIKAIKEDLHNHVTDTDKKIGKLDVKIDQLRTDIYAKFDKTDAKIKQLRTDMYAKFDQLNDKTDAKIDQLRTDIHLKLDSNFNHINLRLDQAFNRPQKEKDV